MTSLPKSLSVRLLLVFIATGIVILLVLSFLFSYGISTEWRQQIRPHLAQYVRYVRKDLGDPPSVERANELANSLPVEIHIFSQGEHVHSTNKSGFQPDEFKFSAYKPGRKLNQLPNKKKSDERTHRQQTQNLKFAQSRHHAVVKITLANHEVFVELDRKIGARNSRRAHLFLIPVVLVVLLGILYQLLRKLLSPIADIKSGVATMTAGNLSHKIPVKRKDDLGQLAESVNGLSSRIQSLLDAKRELLLSVSHELRSPITRAQLAANMIPESKHQTQLLDELRLLDSLIESLIESERLQSEHSALNLSSVDLRDIVEGCVIDLAAEHQNEMGSSELDIDDSLNTLVEADEMRLRLLFRNLLNNAVQHGKSKTENGSPGKLDLRISISGDDKMLVCTIQDGGAGVADSEIDALTDAFYRPDPSRTHGKGGVGLGLSLAQLIAEAHGGSLTLENRTDGASGLQATVKLNRSSQLH